jgi:hypothetical protein
MDTNQLRQGNNHQAGPNWPGGSGPEAGAGRSAARRFLRQSFRQQLRALDGEQPRFGAHAALG